MNNLSKGILSAANRIFGKTARDYRFLGIPVLIIRKRDAWHTDVYPFGIPLLRLIREPKRRGIALLPFTWLHKAIRYLFTKWKIIRAPQKTELSFAGHTIFREIEISPFKFPTAQFRR